MDLINKINNYYALLLKQNLDGAEYNKFLNHLHNYNISEKDLVLKPYFITQKKREEFLKISEILLNVFEKLAFAYFNNNEIRNILSIYGRFKDYIEVNPGYSRKQLVTRFDAFYNISNDSLKFLETNFDNPSNIGTNELYIKIFDQLPPLKYLKKEFDIKSDMMIDILYQLLIKKYKEYCLNFKKLIRDDPCIAITCSRNSFIRDDADLIVKFLKERDLNVCYADPRDFVYDGTVLKLNGKKVDIVYRDILKDFFRTESSGKIHSNVRNKILNYTKNACLRNGFINHFLKKGYFGHAEDIIKAYSENNICIINPFSSGICAQKSSFALIQDDHFKNLFDEEELDTINKYIPWTRIFRPGKTFYDNRQIDLIHFTKLHRHKFVLKPNTGFGGKGILIGPEIHQRDWERYIELIIKSDFNYVVQEYIDVPTEKFPVHYNSDIKEYSPLYININFWGFDGKFVGSYLRASSKKIINITQGGKLVPVYYLVN